ncbi:hypothetical protein EDB19DRAFT_1915358 [Suillus lakei]|nr:hypothetical protein EDB19DRAFT_1915358 [Suillus lakei]
MSRGLLAQLSDAQQVAMGGKKLKYIPKTSLNALAMPISHVVQSFADNLESLFFDFIWICIKFCGPHGQVHQDNLANTIPDCWNNMDLESYATFKGNFFATAKEEHRLVEEIHPYFKDLIPLVREWCTALKDNMESPVSFNNILVLLNSHLDRLPDDEELASTFKMLKESAALLTDHVENLKRAAPQSSSAGLPKWRRLDDDESDS